MKLDRHRIVVGRRLGDARVHSGDPLGSCGVRLLAGTLEYAPMDEVTCDDCIAELVAGYFVLISDA